MQTGNCECSKGRRQQSFEKSGRQIAFNRGRKGYLPQFLQADEKDGERPVREAVVGAYLDAVNEAVEEALSEETNENVDG